MRLVSGSAPRTALVFGACILTNLSVASAQLLRVVTYNIDADTGGAHGARGGDIAGPGLTTVLQAIGNAQLAGHSQSIDVLALEELNAVPSTTLQFVVDQLNGIYGAGTYAYDGTFDPTTGGTGGGPNGLVYNTTTVQLLGGNFAPKAVGLASGSGAPRAPMRYTLAPLGINDHSADFTLYVSHAKANSGSNQASNVARRDVEAHELRDDATTLGPHAHVIYSGDLNILNGAEAADQTLISSSVDSGVGQAIDTVNPANNWTQASTFRNLFSESATSLTARFDFELVTAPMLNEPGMQLVSNTLMPFGNDGSVTNVSNSSASNTALLDLAQSPFTPTHRQSVLTALTTAIDRARGFADYNLPLAVGIPGDYNHNGVVDAADYTLWQNSFGSTMNLAADRDGNGIVDAADYSVWRDHLGDMAPGPGAGASVAVPEPNTATLLILGGCLTGLAAVRLKGWTRKI